MNVQIEDASDNFHTLNRSAGQSQINFLDCVYWRGQAELVAIIVTCAGDTTVVDESPKTRDRQTRSVVKNENPVKFTPYDFLKPKPDQPI